MFKQLLMICIFLILSCPVKAFEDDDTYYPDAQGEAVYESYHQRDNYYYSGEEDDYYPPVSSPKRSKKKHRQVELTSGEGRLAERISPPGEKVIVVDPSVHAWGAYSESGELLRSGIATSGGKWCSDIERSCRTSVGSYRIYSLGSFNCVSKKFPLGRGGAPMPYCMFFNGGQGLHGSYQVVDGNVSHGCVRLHVDDAEWLRFNFAKVGTKVIVRPY